MYCPVCSVLNRDAAKFCKNCGKPFTKEPEKHVDAISLMQNLESILDDIYRNGVVYIIKINANDGFVLGPEKICGRVLGLVDPEYGWPFPIEIKDIKSVFDVAPDRRRHPFIYHNGVCLAVGIQIVEYEKIKKKYPNQ